MLLYIIRHGDPIYAPDSLTPKGHLQAAALAKRLAVHGLDKIFASPLVRAQQTAKPTCELLGLDCQIEEWTSENAAWQDLSVTNEQGRRTWAFHVQNTVMMQDNPIREDWYDSPAFGGRMPGRDMPALSGNPIGFWRSWAIAAKGVYIAW